MKSITTAAVLCVLCCCTDGCDDPAHTPGPKRGTSQSTTQGQPSMFTFDNDCAISSVPVPAGYEYKADHSRRTVWLTPKGRPDAAMVVCLFSLKHDTVKAAQQGRDGFRDFAAGGRTWRVAMPDPNEETGNEDSFMAILVLKDTAVAAYGSGLGWTETDLRGFLADVRLAH